VALHKDNEAERAVALVARLRDGAQVALVSDAGMPAVSDPGAALVARCAAEDIVVTAVPGPSAVTTAVAVSGLGDGRFVFEGFLPRRDGDRRRRCAELARETRAVVVFEAPGRTAATLAAFAEACGAERAVVVCRELTKLHEEVWRGTLGDAAAHFVDPVGEIVLVVDGAAPAVVDVDDDALDAYLSQRLAAGRSVRDAAGDAAAVFDVPRRRAYERAVAVRNT
jgi:16S rRNA (cytidine1402-2'-O)-methyltransferase